MYYPLCTHFTHKRLKNFTTCFVVVGNMVFAYHPTLFLIFVVQWTFFIVFLLFLSYCFLFWNACCRFYERSPFPRRGYSSSKTHGLGGGWIKCHRNNHWHQCAGTGTAFWCLGWWMCPCSITVSSHTEHLLKWSNETTYQGWGTGCAGGNMNQKTDKSKKGTYNENYSSGFCFLSSEPLNILEFGFCDTMGMSVCVPIGHACFQEGGGLIPWCSDQV